MKEYPSGGVLPRERGMQLEKAGWDGLNIEERKDLRRFARIAIGKYFKEGKPGKVFDFQITYMMDSMQFLSEARERIQEIFSVSSCFAENLLEKAIRLELKN
jgi:hypothetical protein